MSTEYDGKRCRVIAGFYKGEIGTVLEHYPKTQIVKVLLDSGIATCVWDCRIDFKTMPNPWLARRTAKQIREIGKLWGTKRWRGCGRFPPDGKFMGLGFHREIRKCDFCDKPSIMTADLQDPDEIHWFCEEHESVLYANYGEKR